MTPEHIDRLISAIEVHNQGNDLLLIILILAVAGLSSFLGSYFKRKGENVATKEDIGSITSEVESIKITFQEKIESLRERKELKVAALDRRLEAHQQAFTLWRELLKHVHNDDCTDYVLKCQDWWDKNCLYLDSKSREAFRVAYMSASRHKDLLQDKCRDRNQLEENWDEIIRVADALVEGVELPSLGKSELEEINRNGPNNQTVVSTPEAAPLP